MRRDRDEAIPLATLQRFPVHTRKRICVHAENGGGDFSLARDEATYGYYD